MYSALPVSFKNAALTLYEHPDGYAVFVYQPGRRQVEDFQAGLTQLGELLRRRNWFRVVSDQRVMAPFSEAEQALVVPFWQDFARQQGHGIYAAILLADDVFSRLASNQLHQEVRLNGVTYRLFEQSEAVQAGAWLGRLATSPPA